MMADMLIYMLKFSMSIAVMSLFYHFMLRSLTFYHLNRIYLLAAVGLSVVLPMIDLNGLLRDASDGGSRMMQNIPAVGSLSLSISESSSFFAPATVICMLLMSGSLILLIRLVVQYISLLRLKSNSTLISTEEGIKLFETGREVAPFTFGSGIYIHRSTYSHEEIKRIIQHESVHVRGYHTADMILSEMVCIFNWFNPFSWMLRKQIRHNLEFIADDEVLSGGIEKKNYQYLLLKYSSGGASMPVNTFSAENLKKRIVMMNTVNSSKAQLLRFTALVPVLLFISVLFRENSIVAQETGPVTIESEGGIEIRSVNPKDKAKPMYILDGMVQPEDFDVKSIKAEEIASMSVWKGAEAVKKFGSRAKPDGVISIITKSPKNRKKSRD